MGETVPCRAAPNKKFAAGEYAHEQIELWRMNVL
jgi:hypothetical protein